jgi:peptide deformylase
MHHIHTVLEPMLFQVCAVAPLCLGGGALTMLNPQLMGHGNETDVYTERSASDGVVTRRARYRTALVEWYDAASAQMVWGRFQGAQAACLQLALDEMK